jgi:hypothetical protein
MAVFNKNTLTQVSGFDNQIISGELVYNQNTYWNLTLTSSDYGVTPVVPLDLTGATINAQIIRRQLTNVKDTRYGLSFDISDYTPPPTAIPLTISNRSDVNGSFTLTIDSNAWGLIANDPELDIASINGAGFSGRIKISFPASGTIPANDLIIFLLFLVRSDAIIN